MSDRLEPIRRAFRQAGLYHHAADDLLCGQLADAAAPPAAVPAGYALVSEMLAAAEDGIDSAMTDMGFGGMDVDLTIQRVKRLMLAAAREGE